MKKLIEIEQMAKAIAANEDAESYTVTYVQIANRIHTLGNGVRIEMPLSEMLEEMRLFYQGSQILHMGVIDPDDYKACCMALMRAAQMIEEQLECDIDEVTVSIPSMTGMGVEV